MNREEAEKNFEIIEFELNGKIFKLDIDKNKYFSEDGNYANFIPYLNDKIISVKRLSDDEVFTIGDNITQGKIKFIIIHNNKIYLKV